MIASSVRMRAAWGVVSLVSVTVATGGCAVQGAREEASPAAAEQKAGGAAKADDKAMNAPVAPTASPTPRPAASVAANEKEDPGKDQDLATEGAKKKIAGPSAGQLAPAPTAIPPLDGKGLGGGLGAVLPTKLDPDARYSTTYRPGGAALSAFDAAVSKGTVPKDLGELVGDFGATYAPVIEAPAEQALSFAVDLERTALPKTGGFVGLRVAMRSSAKSAGRAPLSVHLVLDVSGSMAGLAMENAKKAAMTLVDKLEPSDDFSMVTFSTGAQVLVPDGLIGARKAAVLAKIAEVKADGGTNISAGLDLGYAQAASPGIAKDAVKIVMLLSDGHANAGDTSRIGLQKRAAKAFEVNAVQTSTFGLGEDFDAALMSGVADHGAGAYYYVADSAQIAPALTKELDARLQPVAQAVEIRVRLRPDVDAVKAFGSHVLGEEAAALVRAQEVAIDGQVKAKDGIVKDRDTDAAGGMRFFVPAFARDDRHALLLRLAVPAGVGKRSIASIEVRYKDRLTKKNVTVELPVKLDHVDGPAESAKTESPSVRAAMQAFEAGETILAAAKRVDLGDRLGAAKLLDERATILEAAATKLGEPRLLTDAARLRRLSKAVSGTAQVGEPLVLAVLLRGSAHGYLR